MDSKQRLDTVAATGNMHCSPELLHSSRQLYLGIDVGSTSSDVVVMNHTSRILFSDYRRTIGQPVETVRSQLDELFKHLNPANIVLTAATGSAGRFLAKLLDIPFVNEVPAQAAAISHLYPQHPQATVIEMGGQDSKLIFLSSHQGRSIVSDFALNTICAAGTGSFLDQQAQRLGVAIEDEFGRMALQSTNVPRMAGRCSVFAKSDMIHLQQQATPTYDIIAGLCLALARNLKTNLGCGRQFLKPIIFTGGVAANIGVVRALEQVFELDTDGLIVPDVHFFTGAIGAVLVAKNRTTSQSNGQIRLEKIDSYLATRSGILENAPRRPALTPPKLPPPKSKVYDHLLAQASEPINAYLGVDVGSISTNIAVIDQQRRVLAKAYLMTAGRPLEAVKQGLDIVAKKVAGKVNILGAATTGSGRYLTGDFIGADLVINEITAQAAGAAIVNPKVDTIFEIGGQDSKYISLENGVVVDFEMNHACAAGTGSFLEEQAQRLGININQEFANLAFESKAPIKLGERCTVFMESDLLNYQQQGAKTQELVAGLSYSIVTNYLNRVVGRRKIGDNICFQGGTAFNKAVWGAFEQVTGKPIMVPDHHEVTGALGAAAIVAEHMAKIAQNCQSQPDSTFRGFENLVTINYTVESFTCEHCPNNCEVKKVQLPGAQPLYYGSRCDRYNIKKKQQAQSDHVDAFEFRSKKLLECADLADNQDNQDTAKTTTTVGIPMALINYQLLPLFARFFKSLGFKVVLSGQTNKKTIRMGVESSTAEPCFPVKVAFGHIAQLIAKQVDYIFIPSIVSMTPSFPTNAHNQLCPYVQSLAYQAQTAFADKLGRTKLLTVPLRMGEGDRLLRKSFVSLGKELRVSRPAVYRALKKGLAAQAAFENAIKEKGKQILAETKPGEKLFVLISRPYNGCDEGVSLQLPRKLADLGVRLIPMDMLDLEKAELGDQFLHRKTYWTYGQKILRAAEIIKDDPRLFAIYLSNFSCGPDSFMQTFFKDIMAQKPSLQLELDEHSADAGVITRLEAFFESLKHYRPPAKAPQAPAPTESPRTRRYNSQRKLYIPYMGDSTYGVAACYRRYGQPAEVMPIADEATLIQGRQLTTGKECLPCAITIGDMLRVVKTSGFDPDKTAFLMPTADGPCRFGMYNCLQRLILRQVGAESVAVISPDQDGSFYSDFTKNKNGSSANNFMKDMWIAAIGIDLLHKLILRLRPFTKDPRRAQQLYDSALASWITAVEQGHTLPQYVELMDSLARQFAYLEVDPHLQKPKIGIVGEIYVRSHPFANKNIVARLEELGAVCELAALAEWIYYTNFARRQMLKRTRQLRKLAATNVHFYIQKKTENALARPLERIFGPIAEGSIQHVINLGNRYIHQSFEGEAILSVGKIVEFYEHGFGGVINVMPFTCMPSTIVSTQTLRISADCGNMPILNLSFDGQEDPTLTTRLEAFVEQVRQKQQGLLTPANLLSV